MRRLQVLILWCDKNLRVVALVCRRRQFLVAEELKVYRALPADSKTHQAIFWHLNVKMFVERTGILRSHYLWLVFVKLTGVRSYLFLCLNYALKFVKVRSDRVLLKIWIACVVAEGCPGFPILFLCIIKRGFGWHLRCAYLNLSFLTNASGYRKDIEVLIWRNWLFFLFLTFNVFFSFHILWRGLEISFNLRLSASWCRATSI